MHGGFSEDMLTAAHAASMGNGAEIARSRQFGCFYCMSVAPAATITEWIDEPGGTPLCPKCGMDAVLADASGFDLSPEFLRAMNYFWFVRTV